MASKPKKQATLTDWCIVKYPEIYADADNPAAAAYARYTDDTVTVLLGKAFNDIRFKAKTDDAFAEGHILITSPIMAVKGNEYHTVHTIYTLSEDEKNAEYRKWCKDNP